MRHYRAFGWLWVGCSGLLAVTAFGQYQPARLPDPARRWSVDLDVRSEYDDNIFTSSRDRDESFKATVNPRLLGNLSSEQSFAGLRYGYGATWYENRPGDEIDQSHSVDLLLSHTFNPRLVLNLNDRFRYTAEPALEDIEAGQPVELRRQGDYYYNNLNGGLRYNLSRRWQAAVSGNWEWWDYQDTASETNNNRQAWSSTASAIYMLSPRTSLGGNYRYSMLEYDLPQIDDRNNYTSHIIFASLVHQLNPQLSGRLDAGGEYREYDDGSNNTGPFLDSSLSYAYAPGSMVTGGFRYSLTATDTDGYQSSDTASIFGRLNHRITPKLSAGCNLLLALVSYEDPDTPLLDDSPQEYDYSAGVSARYAFTRWFSSDIGYSYDRTSSELSGRSFTRNRVYLGCRLTY